MTVTTIHVDEELLEQARKVAGTTTHHAAIDAALRELVERGQADDELGRIVDLQLNPRRTKVNLEF